MQAARARRRPLLHRARAYDAVAALTRVATGWVFAGYALTLRSREPEVADKLSDAGLALLTFAAPILPAILLAVAVAFAVGLLTWLTGPILAGSAVLGTLLTGPPASGPFGSWEATVLVSAACVLLAVHGGRWSWDYLVLAPRIREHARNRREPAPATAQEAPAVSTRRPEHAPPLLYPVRQAALRRPYRL